MKNQSNPSPVSGPAADGGFSPPDGAAGFFVSLKSLFVPLASSEAAVRPAPVELPAGPLRLLPGMPRAAGADRPAPRTFPSAGDAHPLRRVAGSAGRWKKRLAEAKQTWPLATVDELVATDGHVQKLAGLIQERYGIGRESAEQQVLRFLGEHDGRYVR